MKHEFSSAMASLKLVDPRNWVIGYRFHPTDYELANYFLRRKISGDDDNPMQIPDIKVCDLEPWDIPGIVNSNSEDQVWYFFCPRDYKYLHSSRSNRTTKAGYWKPTGKPRKVKDKHNKKEEIGTKRSLVFYIKDRPKATRTKWIMHEYDIQGNFVICKLKFKPDAEKAKIVAASNAASSSDIETLKLTEMTSNSSCDECEPSIRVASPNEMTAMSTYVNDEFCSLTWDFENQNPNKENDTSVSDEGEWIFLAPTSPDFVNQNQSENTDMSTSSIVANVDSNASETTSSEVDLQAYFGKLEALLELEEDNRFFQLASPSESGSYTTSFDTSVFGGVGSEMEWVNEYRVY